MSSIQGLQKQKGAYAGQSQVMSHQISTPVHRLCYFPFSWNGAPATVTKIVPASLCNHTYFSSLIAIGSKVAPRLRMYGAWWRGGPQSMFPSIMVSVAHFVSVGVLAQCRAHSGLQLVHCGPGVWVGGQHV